MAANKRKSPRKVKPRIWMHVVPRGPGTGREWAVIRSEPGKRSVRGGIVVTVQDTKRDALMVARDVGRQLWRDTKEPVQVVIHNADGVIRADATYGADPKRSRG